MNNMYRVTQIVKLRFSMEIEAESESEAKRKFESYVSKGACNGENIGMSTQIEEIKEGDTE